MKYIDVVIDNKSDSTDMLYTYACEDENVKLGSKVHVPFARSKNLREGYVINTVSEDSLDPAVIPKIRKVDHVDDEISLTEEMVSTAVWMRGRYVCRYIDAIHCFTPVGSKAKRGGLESVISDRDEEDTISKTLTPEQEAALEIIGQAIDRHEAERFLIHGVTGSGKTEVYIRSAEETLKKGRGVIILVPEISLTGQVIDRFTEFFGDDSVAVLHSRLTQRQRYDQWQRIHSGDVRIVIGARSAVFAPVENLGLIVVDEEHEATYKSDYTPKYDTIEVAIKRLQDNRNRGVLILGSATPSVVSYSRSQEGIYKLIKLTKRYNDVQMPSAEIIDMRQELKDGNRSVVSRRMVTAINEQLRAGKQVMLLMNRRGYSTFISCRECGYVAKCPTCGLSLTYHNSGRMLECHYCGHSEPAPDICPECGSRYIRYFGTGTEKVEEEIRQLFPESTVERIDLDSVKKKGELSRKLKAFGKGKIDILIGTQLIAKGLDFRNVGLAGIISADVSLNIPDYRSPERTFQLITQAAGRAGRGEEAGKVIIQTYNPDHYAVTLAAKQDFNSFYEAEMKFRNLMGYPPLSDVFQIVFTANDPEIAGRGAQNWYEAIMSRMTEDEQRNVFRPQEAYMSKIRDTYRYSLVIKCPKGQRRHYADILREVKESEKTKKNEYIAVVDINPYSFR